MDKIGKALLFGAGAAFGLSALEFALKSVDIQFPSVLDGATYGGKSGGFNAINTIWDMALYGGTILYLKEALNKGAKLFDKETLSTLLPLSAAAIAPEFMYSMTKQAQEAGYTPGMFAWDLVTDPLAYLGVTSFGGYLFKNGATTTAAPAAPGGAGKVP